MPDKLTSQEIRQINGSVDMFQNMPKGHEIGFTHKVFAQNCLPYKSLGDNVTSYVRINGNSGLKIEAGSVWDSRCNQFVTPGLPYGGGARLALFFIITEAKRTGKARIDLGNSFTEWANHLYGVGTPNGRKHNLDGRQIKRQQDQMIRLSSCTFTLGIGDGDHSFTNSGKLVKNIELWTPKNKNQKMLWPSYIELSQEFFDSLTKAIILVDLRAIMHLSGKPMAMDIYTWLAQRLWYVEQGKTAFVDWGSLKSQFCQSNNQPMKDFKKAFRGNLKKALMEYSQSRKAVNWNDKGLYLKRAPPPVPPKGQNPLLL